MLWLLLNQPVQGLCHCVKVLVLRRGGGESLLCPRVCRHWGYKPGRDILYRGAKIPKAPTSQYFETRAWPGIHHPATMYRICHIIDLRRDPAVVMMFFVVADQTRHVPWSATLPMFPILVTSLGPRLLQMSPIPGTSPGM